jgi:proteasome lid subunit RPN8/RPN11
MGEMMDEPLHLDTRPRLLLTDDLAAEIGSHGERAYPEESCGGLLGAARDDAVEIIATVPLPNRHEDERRRRYLIEPDDVRDLERRADRLGLEVVGFYHSHPDAPAAPSAYDREHSWPWYMYLIIGVRDGTAHEINAWRLAHDRTQFDRIAIGRHESP